MFDNWSHDYAPVSVSRINSLQTECPECDGEGTVFIEVWVNARPNGGFLEDRETECFHCDGLGSVLNDEVNEDV